MRDRGCGIVCKGEGRTARGALHHVIGEIVKVGPFLKLRVGLAQERIEDELVRARGIEGMGFGDVKLMGMIGAFLGLKLTVLTIFAASIAGSFFGISTVASVWIQRTRRLMQRSRMSAAQAQKRAWQSAQLVYRNYEMPFGVFLGSMALLALFFGEPLMKWYWGLL